jgi:hypothetical protein
MPEGHYPALFCQVSVAVPDEDESSRVEHRDALTCGIEPEVGFEPTTFRLRVGFSASTWLASDGSSLLTLRDSSVQMAPDRSRRIVWMINGMINAHPINCRMARQAVLELGLRPAAMGTSVAAPR